MKTNTVTEVRHPKYVHKDNPLFTKEEAEYWDNLVLPTDKEYADLMEMTQIANEYQLYKKIGYDRFNAFMIRMQEDDPNRYEEYCVKPTQEMLPF